MIVVSDTSPLTGLLSVGAADILTNLFSEVAIRPQLLSAFWALVRRWDRAWRPKSSRTSSSFPEWAEVVGGIVENAGDACALGPGKTEAATEVLRTCPCVNTVLNRRIIYGTD